MGRTPTGQLVPAVVENAFPDRFWQCLDARLLATGVACSGGPFRHVGCAKGRGLSIPLRIAHQPRLAGREKLLAPAVIQIGADTFLPPKLGDAVLAPQPLQHNADRLLGGTLPPGLAIGCL